MNHWKKILKLNENRDVMEGSSMEMTKKLLAGADLRIGTAFYHDEHIDPLSTDHQLVEETSDFPQTIVLDSSWSAGIMTYRQPVSLKGGFGPGAYLSLFMYNLNGQQALARLALDTAIGYSDDDKNNELEKMSVQSVFDPDSLSPSKNFIYDFEYYEYLVGDTYEEVYANDRDGNCSFGSMDELAKAYRSGNRIKISIKGLLSFLHSQSQCMDEVFVQCGCSYYYTRERLMITNTNPFVSLPASIPLVYTSKNLNYCWAIAQSDGKVTLRSFDPFTQKWTTQDACFPIRWFVQR